MFQKYDDVGGPAHGALRVRLLRERLTGLGLAGFLVPRADEYQNEYVPACAERLLWLTGFSGSSGLAAVLTEKAALFVDGRYTLQAAAQTDPAVIEVVKGADTKPSDWLAANLGEGDRLGYDPRLHTIGEVGSLATALARSGATLVPVEDNPVTALWSDRPAAPEAPVELHPLEFAGRAAAEKIAGLQGGLREAGEDAALILALDSIAWLFNIRGSDLPHTPFVLSHAILPANGRPSLFIAAAKLGDAARGALAEVADLAEPSGFAAALGQLGAAKARVRIDPSRTSRWIGDRLTEAGAIIREGEDPCILPKARKNAAEIAGARAAHLRDGVAVARFLSWLDTAAASGDALDEIGAAQRLEAFRAEAPELREISFDTIAGSGPNGAIVHYRATRSTNRPLDRDSLFLIDSGGQYRDGTTDITRTVAIGAPAGRMRRHFTLVLKGHIAIATARFPKGTRGGDLDAFARRPLWEAGLDYDHGTGHGVGSYLSVHEGPQGLSKRATAVLEPGMILSNEPGYYRAGAYGIRIENLLLVEEPADVGGERPMMAFETLTLAPIDRRLIEPALLSPDELEWLNAYHKRVAREIGPRLSPADREWLERACAPIVAGES